jgi:hypothetical protein
MIVTTAAMTLFFVAYFTVMRHPLFPAVTMPLTALDRAIPFAPASLVLYASLWFYVSLAPALIVDASRLWHYLAAAAVLAGLGLAIFLFFPTLIPSPDIDWTAHPAFGFLKGIDATGNACPSLHVAFAIFTGAWFQRLLGEMDAGPVARTFNWLWCAGIVYSTVAVRQHVVWDVVAGALLGAAVAALHLAWDRRVAPRPGGWTRLGSRVEW